MHGGCGWSQPRPEERRRARRDGDGEGRAVRLWSAERTWEGKRSLHIPPPPPPSKKQRLASPEPEPLLGDSLRIREESPIVPVQEPRVSFSDDDEEKVDYGYDDTDAYLTELEDAGDAGDVGGSSYMPDDEPNFEAMG
ncbi:uncharacterized protein A4U43_C09F6350 [Asparagus officinalis]|uniref:Uncharacterized protein n=1 Tax=Asparagus officinalis TaxID=4686 RepID=A0A5P1E8Z6_ASPOF|nr:uncharacterized protein A4U43_C09F6350 [Asparagus officinalis]